MRWMLGGNLSPKCPHITRPGCSFTTSAREKKLASERCWPRRSHERLAKTIERTEVWLSNNPLDENEGTKGPVLLEVSVKATHREMAQFEWIEEGKPYREWLIPATFLNSRMVVKVAGGGMSVSPKLSKGQLQALHSLFHLYAPRFLDTTDSGAGSDAARGARLTWASGIIGHELSSFNDLQPDEAAQLIVTMKKALGQEIKPARRARERRPGRDLARAYGTAGRRGE